MPRGEHAYTLVTLLLGFTVLGACARSWDLAVAIGREIDFFAANRTQVGQTKIAESAVLAGLAYDDVTRTVFLSDTHYNVSIFSNDLTEKNFTTKPLLKRQNGTHVSGVVFDTPSRTLYWSDALKEAILKMHVPIDGPASEPVLLHDLTHRKPRGIALDVCNSHIYWVNSNHSNPSVERSKLDGTDRMTIIKEDLYEPLAVTIDHAERKLYWIDDIEGVHFKIERSNLDGTQRELLLRGKHQQPVYLAVDLESIYWSEWAHNAIWTMPKDPQSTDGPKIFKDYCQSNREASPAGLIARDNVGNIDCVEITKMKKRTNPPTSTTLYQRLESYNNLTTSTEESELTTESSKHCLNDGHVDKNDGSCVCKSGYSGAYCETSLCHNYCLQGSCSINNQGLPECKCADTFAGDRCEKNVCDGYCLNDGQCSIQDGKPTCKCKYSKGRRCESLDDITEICAVLCASNLSESGTSNTNPCRCNGTNQAAARMVTFTENAEYRTLLPVFAALITMLVLLIAALSYYVNKLRRRPRIKKRFVVSKGGVTPLTSRPQIPDNQCEITIENCCNMNICETVSEMPSK